jgi:putative restriction endonuclease
MAVKTIIFGEVEGIFEGYFFKDRRVMMENSFHRNWASGIDGNAKEGTSAIVLSGGYEDDLDTGDEIIYTGAGGNKNGKQINNQSWDNKGNAGLLKSMDTGIPVRVIRGYKHESQYSPSEGYLYAGLYNVVDAWEEVGKSGFKICRFRLVYNGNDIKRKSSEEIELSYESTAKKRRKSTVLRVIRDTEKSRIIKELYNYKCQVCDFTIKTKKNFYAEGAHIKPIGKPHNGDDNFNNLLCLCPNHHVMFDKGTFSINNNYTLIGAENGKLYVDRKHKIELDNLKYHREIHGY